MLGNECSVEALPNHLRRRSGLRSLTSPSAPGVQAFAGIGDISALLADWPIYLLATHLQTPASELCPQSHV